MFTPNRALPVRAQGEIKDTTASSPKWLQRVLSRLRPHRETAQGAEQNTVIQPISTNVIVSAEGALRWISKVPGGDKVQVRIGDALQVIKSLNVTSGHNANTLKWLEYHLGYLVELLEPFTMMHRSEITPLLQYEVLMLGRELQTVSLKMRPAVTSHEAPRENSMHTGQHEEHGGNGVDVREFTRDFKLALDHFRANGLPLYPVSPIEAGLLPLGIVSNSSCALSPFLEWILKSERVMEHRIGAVRTVQLCDRPGIPFGRWDEIFILVGLENRRQIENWLHIELSGPGSSVLIFSSAFGWCGADFRTWCRKAQGTVTFGTTRESLHEGVAARHQYTVHIGEDMLPVTHFCRQIQDICAQYRGPMALYRLFEDLRKMYARDPEHQRHRRSGQD